MPARDPWLDNAKMALVTLVVFGHFWVFVPGGAISAQVYDFLYLWHMPAFVLLTGHLSRGFTWRRDRLAGLARTIAVPYLFFEGAMALFRTHVGGETLTEIWLDPHWPMWYLAAVFCWRLATPALQRIPGAIPLALALSVAGGVIGSQYLDLFRVLGFLPFFVIGLHLAPERLALLRTTPARVAAVAVLLVALLGVRFLGSFASTQWLYYDQSYADLGASGAEAVVVRLTLLGAGLLAALAALALVPTVDGWFARLGAASLIVYLFHGFAVRAAEYLGFGAWAQERPLAAAAVVLIGSVGLALALASRPVASRLQVLVDPVGHVRAAVDDATALALRPARAELVLAETEPQRMPVGAGSR